MSRRELFALIGGAAGSAVMYHAIAELGYARESSYGEPRRFREVQADFHGHVAELLAKATSQGRLDAEVTREDKEMLLEAMRDWGALGSRYEYKMGLTSSDRRGFNIDPRGGARSPRLSGSKWATSLSTTAK